MFDLEQAIAGWRWQMRAAGIKDQELLDELEGHLGEEAEQQMAKGATAQQAFEIARQKMGRIEWLKEEFAKTKRPFGWLGGRRPTKTGRALAALWLVGCAWSFITMCRLLASAHNPSALPEASLLALNIIIAGIYVVGLLGSVLLFQGAVWGHRIINWLAVLLALACIAQMLDFRLPGPWRVWCAGIALFSLVSILHSHLSQRADPKHDTAAEQ